MSGRAPSAVGFSVVELLVAAALLVLGMLLALDLFDRTRRLFKYQENVIDQQQSVRIAFDAVSAVLRQTGLNVNPDGAIGRPDEPIEAAYDTAIVIRADLDGAGAAARTPESALAGGAFDNVSTGNDEIVAYVLAKPDGSSTDEIVFEADVGQATRDGTVEIVRIPGIALVQDDPPYTLYRITLNNDPSSYPGGRFVVRTPLADNVRRMNFRYYDLAGVGLNTTNDPSDPADDIGGGDTAGGRSRRGSIRRLAFDVEGLTRDPDSRWHDPGDSDPETRHLRKFRLSGEITPRNLGLQAALDLLALNRRAKLSAGRGAG